jgi:hypothetical protein
MFRFCGRSQNVECEGFCIFATREKAHAGVQTSSIDQPPEKNTIKVHAPRAQGQWPLCKAFRRTPRRQAQDQSTPPRRNANGGPQSFTPKSEGAQ